MEKLKKAKPNILVIGDLMLDHYLWGSCERISPEAPVAIVDVEKETTVLGGAGNVINNLVSLGAKVSACSVIGDDANGQELIVMLKNIGVKTDNLVIQDERKTSKKSRVIAVSQQILRYDKESKENIKKASEQKILVSLKKTLFLYDAIILSDYGKGVLTPFLCQEIIKIATKVSKKVFIDPKGDNYLKYSGAYLLTPNKKEASLATKIDIKDDKSLKDALLKLQQAYKLDISMITLSEDGIAIHDGDIKTFPTITKEVYDVTGAGDTVIASMAFAMSAGFNIEQSCKFANLAAGVVVGKIGSATVTLSEIEEYEASLHKGSSDAHIKNFKEIENIVIRAKKDNKNIVFTNGCFDILHVGHVKYLQVAKSFGDILIVGLNSDNSVKKLKGTNRPVNEQTDRAYILAALECVDYVVIFNDETPYRLIELIRPDILVKGGDYANKEVIGTKFARKLELVDFIDGKSTTKIIEKIGGKLC